MEGFFLFLFFSGNFAGGWTWEFPIPSRLPGLLEAGSCLRWGDVARQTPPCLQAAPPVPTPSNTATGVTRAGSPGQGPPPGGAPGHFHPPPGHQLFP